MRGRYTYTALLECTAYLIMDERWFVGLTGVDENKKGAIRMIGSNDDCY